MAEEDDNPFAVAGGVGDDDYNPFDDSMFTDKRKQQAAAASAGSTVASEQPSWDVKDQTEEVKVTVKKTKEGSTTATVVKTEATTLLKPSTKDEEIPPEQMPSWAREGEDDDDENAQARREKGMTKTAKKKQSAAVKGQNFGDDNTSNIREPLLGGGGITSRGVPNDSYDPDRRPNWPPFPRKCMRPFKPCFYQNFDHDIPPWGMASIKIVYCLWWSFAVALFWNLISSLAALDCGDCGHDTVTGMFLALAYFLIGAPCAYYLWFRTLYNAFRVDSSLKFGCFFCMFMMQIALTIIMAIGIPGWGMSGFFTAIKLKKDGNEEVAIMGFVAAIVWVMLSIFNLIAVQKVLFVFRNSGQFSVEAARKEAAANAGQAAFAASQTDAGKEAIRGAAQASWDSNA